METCSEGKELQTHTHEYNNTETHTTLKIHIHSCRPFCVFLSVQTQSNDFLNSNKAVFILLGWTSIPHPLAPPPPPPHTHPALQLHHSRISFPPRIPLKRCHVGWRQSAEMLLRYSCPFSKAPNSIYGHIYYHVCQCLKGSFIIRSTHLIWSQQAASLGQYALYYTVRASHTTEEKENMSKQKTR